MPAPKGHAPYPGCETGGKPKVHTQEFIEKEAEALIEWLNKKKMNLFAEDFAYERGYSYKRLLDFSKVNEKFEAAYDHFIHKQKTALMKGSLTKEFAHPMCALILGHSHGIVAKTEQKVSGDAANPLAFILKDVDGTTKDLVTESDEEE